MVTAMESSQTPGATPPERPDPGAGLTPSGSVTPVPGYAEAADYPVRVDVERQETYQRWLPLVKWLLAIPHYIVLVFAGIGALFALVYAFFATIFTGRWPRGAFDFVLRVLQYAWRVNSYVFLMRDEYPSFALGDDPDYPAHLSIAYPDEEIERWRPLVAWLLGIPYLIVASLLMQLSGLMTLFAFFTILFTERYPESLFNIAVIGFRWQARANAYVYWMVPRYPPFAWG